MSILYIYLCVHKDIGIKKEKETCLPNKESVSVDRCERTDMVAKCEIFMNCNKTL